MKEDAGQGTITMTENTDVSVTTEEVQTAIASLAMRVTQLEKDNSANVGASGDGSELRPAFAATLEDLKTLRTSLLTSYSEVDVKIKELKSVKEENAKLKYQIKHLVRSLEAAEK